MYGSIVLLWRIGQEGELYRDQRTAVVWLDRGNLERKQTNTGPVAIILEGCISQYNSYCIGGMHLTIH